MQHEAVSTLQLPPQHSCFKGAGHRTSTSLLPTPTQPQSRWQQLPTISPPPVNHSHRSPNFTPSSPQPPPHLEPEAGALRELNAVELRLRRRCRLGG